VWSSASPTRTYGTGAAPSGGYGTTPVRCRHRRPPPGVLRHRS
jgi:hypothetical protein